VKLNVAREVALARVRLETHGQYPLGTYHEAEETDQYEFFVEATGEHAAPGRHWLVAVKKLDCSIKFQAGR
jgi:hypothetical protein